MHFLAYGQRWQSDIDLARFTQVPPGPPPDITVTLVGSLAQRELMPLFPGASVQAGPGGFRYTAPEATLDIYDPGRIEVLPGPAWSPDAPAGPLPAGFYGTVTALLLARRGAIPLHGSAVELDGQAILLCGPSGAGKSTLAAGLIAHGARLISDDLSILHLDRTTGRFGLHTGRRTLRLFERTAGYLAQAVPFAEPPFIADRKLAVTPPISALGMAFPLNTLMLLRSAADANLEANGPGLLAQQLFRPAWMRRMPGQPMRLAALAIAEKTMSIVDFPLLPVDDGVTFAKQSATALEICLPFLRN